MKTLGKFKNEEKHNKLSSKIHPFSVEAITGQSTQSNDHIYEQVSPIWNQNNYSVELNGQTVDMKTTKLNASNRKLSEETRSCLKPEDTIMKPHPLNLLQSRILDRLDQTFPQGKLSFLEDDKKRHKKITTTTVRDSTSAAQGQIGHGNLNLNNNKSSIGEETNQKEPPSCFASSTKNYQESNVWKRSSNKFSEYSSASLPLTRLSRTDRSGKIYVFKNHHNSNMTSSVSYANGRKYYEHRIFKPSFTWRITHIFFVFFFDSFLKLLRCFFKQFHRLYQTPLDVLTSLFAVECSLDHSDNHYCGTNGSKSSTDNSSERSSSPNEESKVSFNFFLRNDFWYFW